MIRNIYPLRRPKFAKGIRSQESRAGTGRADWAKKWFAALERIDLGGRYGRARNYAMSGQVTELTVDGNVVRAKVQGVRAEEYAVTVDFRVPTESVHDRIVSAIRREPMLVARLLAGELPLEVEEIFRSFGFDLYPGAKLPNSRPTSQLPNIQTSKPPNLQTSKPPNLQTSKPPNLQTSQRLYDVVTACSCPDYANPCKHVFAALIILGEEVARRPSLLVELRGITMEELV